jgi:hypothetical protein
VHRKRLRRGVWPMPEGNETEWSYMHRYVSILKKVVSLVYLYVPVQPRSGNSSTHNRVPSSEK